MAVKWVQKIYDNIKNYRWPWLTRMLGIVEKDILIPAAQAIGKVGVDFLLAQVIAESKKDIKGTDKFQNVYNACRKQFPVETIGDDFLNNIIQNTVSTMKFEKYIN